MTGQCLVNGIIDHLIDHMVQAGTVISVADIHAGAFTDRLKAFQHLNGGGAIFAIFGFGHIVFTHHSGPVP